ncbi:hypothetical protein J4Q44_G00068130 [Coregonus suidteri]|uniref:Uncharacterized protein n=1 Tax=Coregonus suidteri TaxID=861788 RepID=A0AAN8N533_9TELE
MVRSKRQSYISITRREGMRSSSPGSRSRCTSLKSGGTRGKLKRLFPKPLSAQRKGPVLTPIIESICTDHSSRTSCARCAGSIPPGRNATKTC